MLTRSLADVRLRDVGYEQTEWACSGHAESYRAPAGLPTDGRWTFEVRDHAEFTTRVLIRRPSDDSRFSGTVVVEWLNVSAGFDSAPDYINMADEIVRGGYAWVGVSAQRIGIEGGAVAVSTPVSAAAGAGQGIKALDPERYGDLEHPGDSYSFDIFTQVGRALRQPGDVEVLGGLDVERILAVGESQSGFALTSYINGVQPLTGAFDGFVVHRRGGAAAPLSVEDGAGVDIAATITGPPTRIRTDGAAPVIIL